METKTGTQQQQIRKLVDDKVLDFRREIGGGLELQLVANVVYVAGFLGSQGSINADNISLHPQKCRLVHVDGDVYLLPGRISEAFAADVKARFPRAKIELGHFVSMG